MARLRFEDGMFTLTDGDITTRFDVSDDDLIGVRDFLVERYPIEKTTSPLQEISLEDARHGDIATFELYGERYVCTLRELDGRLVADTWIVNRMNHEWRIRLRDGRAGELMSELRFWRWHYRPEPKIQVLEEPEPGVYITRDRMVVLFNDGDKRHNWSKIQPIEKWNCGARWTNWDSVVQEIGKDNLPLISAGQSGLFSEPDDAPNTNRHSACYDYQ